VAGAVDSDIFEPGAVESIYVATGGVPRLINRLCHAAMVAAYGACQRNISASIVSRILTDGAVSERTVNAADVSLPPIDGRESWNRQHIEAPNPARSTTRDVSKDCYGGALVNDTHSAPNASASVSPYGDGSGFGGTIADDEQTKVERLQRYLLQAEHVCATTDAKLARLCSIEKHLEQLSQSAERLIAGLSHGLRQAGHAFEQMQGRMEKTLADAERRVNDIDVRATRALDMGRDLSDGLVRAETECDRARAVSTKLGAFADQLADSVDEMQSRAAPLLDTIHMAEELQARLEASCRKATLQASEVES